MIVITRGEHSFMVSGHSGYAERGSDIVCAAVSALEFTFVSHFDAPIEQNGDTDIVYFTDDLIPYVDFIFSGFREIESSYPDYVLVGGGRASSAYCI